jgi:hypothetical protein
MGNPPAGRRLRALRRLRGMAASSLHPRLGKASSEFEAASRSAASFIFSTALAAWRYCWQSCAPRGASAIRFVERSAKLFDEVASHRRIGKAPAIIGFAFLQDYTPVPRLDVSRIVKIDDSTTQSNIQPFLTDSKLDDVRVFPLIHYRLSHIATAG